MAYTAKADLGQGTGNYDDLYVEDTLQAGKVTGGLGGGTFTATAAALTTISDSDIVATSNVIVVANNAAAGLLMQSKTCYVSGIGAGFFTFVVSATGSGAPAGTEAFQYLFLRET